MAKFRTKLEPLLLKKSAKARRRITHQEVADATGLSLPTISRWMSGTVARLEVDTIQKFCEYFECDFYDLIEYDKDANGE